MFCTKQNPVLDFGKPVRRRWRLRLFSPHIGLIHQSHPYHFGSVNTTSFWALLVGNHRLKMVVLNFSTTEQRSFSIYRRKIFLAWNLWSFWSSACSVRQRSNAKFLGAEEARNPNNSFQRQRAPPWKTLPAGGRTLLTSQRCTRTEVLGTRMAVTRGFVGRSEKFWSEAVVCRVIRLNGHTPVQTDSIFTTIMKMALG